MIESSKVSDELILLNREILDLEKSFKFKTETRSCGSDCFCRKGGKHKITKSAYHKNCIRMKKNSASVKKTELFRPRNKSKERKEVYNLGKAQVEVSMKTLPKVLKGSCENSNCDVLYKRPMKSNDLREKPVKLVDAGCDPITVVESKRNPRKCWSSVLSEGSRNYVPRVTSSAVNIPFEPPVKRKSISTSSSSPAVDSTERISHKSKQSVSVRDRGIQCQNLTEGLKYSDPVGTPPLYDPVYSLQSLLKDLKIFKKNLHDIDEKDSLSSIISDMNSAINRITQPNQSSVPVYSDCTERRKNGVPYPAVPKDGGLTSKALPAGLDKALQDTCHQLKSSCLKLEKTCQKLQKEKDEITEQFFEKSRELESCLKRELEYQTKLSDAHQSVEIMSKKLDQYSKSMEELSVHVTRLQAENKVLSQSEEVNKQLLDQLMEASKENEKLSTNIQVMTLEREKYLVLLDIKEQELTKLKAELRSIGGLVSEKMFETAMTNDSMVISSQLRLSDSREYAFSSPDGTLKSPSKSWKAVSSILSPNYPRQLLNPQPKVAKVPLQHKEEGTERKNPLESINHLRKELRDLFAQMKQQTETVAPPDAAPGSEISAWSTLTDSSDGYNSITERELSGAS